MSQTARVVVTSYPRDHRPTHYLIQAQVDTPVVIGTLGAVPVTHGLLVNLASPTEAEVFAVVEWMSAELTPKAATGDVRVLFQRMLRGTMQTDTRLTDMWLEHSNRVGPKIRSRIVHIAQDADPSRRMCDGTPLNNPPADYTGKVWACSRCLDQVLREQRSGNGAEL